jgi:hypothetical protein
MHDETTTGHSDRDLTQGGDHWAGRRALEVLAKCRASGRVQLSAAIVRGALICIKVEGAAAP